MWRFPFKNISKRRNQMPFHAWFGQWGIMRALKLQKTAYCFKVFFHKKYEANRTARKMIGKIIANISPSMK